MDSTVHSSPKCLSQCPFISIPKCLCQVWIQAHLCAPELFGFPACSFSTKCLNVGEEQICNLGHLRDSYKTYKTSQKAANADARGGNDIINQGVCKLLNRIICANSVIVLSPYVFNLSSTASSGQFWKRCFFMISYYLKKRKKRLRGLWTNEKSFLTHKHNCMLIYACMLRMYVNIANERYIFLRSKLGITKLQSNYHSQR